MGTKWEEPTLIEGTPCVQNWTLQPVLPWSLWWGLATTTLVLLLLTLRNPLLRRSPARWLCLHLPTTLLPIMLLGLLLNPGNLLPSQVPMASVPVAIKPKITLLLDTSASMSVRDENQRWTRYETAIAALHTLIEELGDQVQVELMVFDQHLRKLAVDALPGTAQGRATHLQSALAQLLQRDPRQRPQMVLILSDGIDQPQPGKETPGLGSLAVQAAGLGIPIHTRALGQPDRFQDLSVELVQEQMLTIQEGTVRWRLRVHHQGLAGKTVTLRYRGAGRGNATPSVLLDARPMQEIDFDLTYDTPGQSLEDWEIDPVPNEATFDNNQTTGFVRVLDQPLQILGLETTPSPEHRRLMRELETDARLHVRSFLQLGPDRWLYREWKSDASPPRTQFWTTLDEASATQRWIQALDGRWDVLILGRDLPAFFHSDVQQLLEQTIRREGRSLLLYRGLPEALTLDGHSPTIPGPQPYGLGQVLAMAWRQALRGESETRTPDLEAPGFGLKWIHQLAIASQSRQDQPILLRARQVIHDPQSPVMLDVYWPTHEESVIPTQVALQNLEATDLPPLYFPIKLRQAEWGWGEADCGMLPPGRYRAWIEDQPSAIPKQLLLAVRSQDQEMRDLQPQPQTLAELARLSGGLTLSAHHPGHQIISHWQQTLLDKQSPAMIFLALRDRWWLLVILLGLGCLAWTLLRREESP